jgi:hypothetical protein
MRQAAGRLLFSVCARSQQHPRDKEIHDADTMANSPERPAFKAGSSFAPK